MGGKIDRALQWRQRVDRGKSRARQRAGVAIQQERMFAAVEMVQRMLREELRKIRLLADDMLARGDQHAARPQHAKHLPAGAVEIARMMQDGTCEDQIERRVGERQPLGKLLDHLDRQLRLLRQSADRRRSHDRARIGLQCGDGKAGSGERIA
ncbi:hypothetical protein chiPu_0033936, partial [Chiloscyllium punctatum]|nr:hypothetical protein [Chiloscyllium punctatum]